CRQPGRRPPEDGAGAGRAARAAVPGPLARGRLLGRDGGPLGAAGRRPRHGEADGGPRAREGPTPPVARRDDRLEPQGHAWGRVPMTGLALRNPIAILMACIAVIVFAVYVTPRLGVDTFPELTPPVLVVGTLAPGLGPKDVEKTITW